MRNSSEQLQGAVTWFKQHFIKQSVAMEAEGISFAGDAKPPTVAELETASSSASITSLLRYDRYDEETGLYFNLDSVGFVVYVSPTPSLSEERLRTLEGIFTNAYRSDTIIQVSLIADPNVQDLLTRWKDARGRDSSIKNAEVYRGLAARRVDYLSKANWKSLFLTETHLIRDYHLLVSVVQPYKKGQDELPRVELDEMRRHQDAVIGVLGGAGLIGEPLKPQGLINLISRFFQVNVAGEPSLPRYKYDPAVPIREQLVPDETALYVGRDAVSLRWRDNFVSVLPYSVRQYPASWFGGGNGEFIGRFFNRVQRINCPFMITMTANIPDQVSAHGRAKQKALRAGQMKETPVGKMIKAWGDRFRDWSFVDDRMDQGSKLLQVTTSIILFAPQGSEEQCQQSLRSVYSSIGWRIVKTRFAVLSRFVTALPMGVGRDAFDLIRRKKFFRSMLSWNVVNLAPWMGEWKGNVPNDADPQLMFVGRRGQINFVDPFRNTQGNYNATVVATSGAGKSVFTQEFLIGHLSQGGRAFVIDSGRSYENICNLLGGTFLTFAPKDKPRMNPFTNIIDPATEQGRMDPDNPQNYHHMLQTLKIIIGEMADPVRPISTEQAALLEAAINEAWYAKKNQADITLVSEKLAEMDNPEAKRLAVMLRPFTRDGVHGEYFDGPANINLNNSFVVLELDDLQGKIDLQSVVLLILMQRIMEVMYLSDRGQRKVCLIDEAWKLLKAGNAGTFIETGYRTARKYNGSFWTITQKVSDFYNSEVSKAAFMNSDYGFFLRQKPESISEARAKNMLSMNDYEEQVYRSLDTINKPDRSYSELAVRGPDGMAVGMLMLDKFSAKMMSTKGEDVAAIKKLEAQGLSKFEAIAKVAGV